MPRRCRRTFEVMAGVAAVIMALAVVAPVAQAPAAAFEIVPGERFGPIAASTSRADLPRLLPRARIVDAEVYIGEGNCSPGTRVFAGTPDTIDIVWADAGRSRVAFVRSISPGGRWATKSGVRIGTMLTDLERVAGHVLTFSGFGWDYGGGLNWDEPTGTLGLRLDVDPRDRDRAAGPAAAPIYGDRLVRSDLPLVRRIRVLVTELTIAWGTPASERFCG
jgi:hypothetical protein